MGRGVNTKADEYFPFLTNDGQTIFYTSRRGESADENLFTSQAEGGRWSSGSRVGGFNTGENEGMTTLVKDGRHVYFTACGREAVLGTCDIWRARVDGQEIYDLESSPGQLNSNAWESQASIGCDGSVLYFASNRDGGEGGTDIWKCLRQPSGNWGEPINLGPQINTPYDEEAPFITKDGRALFFSSTGHIGLGEQDIFMTRQNGDNEWAAPVNLGMPVNSSYRELGFFLSADGKTGYFASDRAGGMGGMDIYHFELPDALQSEQVTYTEGVVTDSITHRPVEGAKVVIKERQTVTTDEAGRFFLCVDAGGVLDIKILHKNYHPYQQVFHIPEWDNSSFFSIEYFTRPII